MAANPLNTRGAERQPKRPSSFPFDRGRISDIEGAVSQVRSTVNAQGEALSSVPQIIGTYTVAQLPDPTLRVGKYARVTDLFGDKVDLVLASQTGAVAYWQPVRPNYAGMRTASSQTIEPLNVPSALILTGSIGAGVTRTLTLGTATAFPGASFDLRFTGSLLGALNVAGLGLGSAVSLALGAYRKFVCVMNGNAFEWRQIV
ncbi:hypothetical protein [Qipengyuania pacifica]|uniref:hypothetical protein n=1 Tax=Qipengyuania pacifica TaxID=2860199 RepID=UPI001C9D77D2|nr:hypothetical protein [Qipengyuania pacifica]MBY8333116.1 hypothetical protein [Qipengyuania pacifica]